MARGEQLMRQWNLLKRLQTRGEGCALRELAGDFGVSERTIQRDFEILEEIGFPIEHEDDDYGKRFWRLRHDLIRSGPLLLRLTEAISLQLAARLFQPLVGTHYADAWDEMLAKIRRIVPKKALDHFAELDKIIYVRLPRQTDYRAHRETIRTLEACIRERTSARVRYTSLTSTRPRTTRFDPYGMVYYEGDLFVLGHSHRARDRRILKISRIASVEPTNDSFRPPRGYDLEAEFRSSFGIFRTAGRTRELVVRFTGIGAKLVQERVWHGSQRLRVVPPERDLFSGADRDPEAVVATYALSDFTEFKRWIKGFGDTAEVLRPDWLRAELREELLAAARLYER